MKSFQLKLILTFYILGSIVIIAMGSSIMYITKQNNELIIKVMVLALMLLAIICIMLAVFTVKKIIEPMSRMLKSGNTYDEIDDIQVEDYDPENLIKELKDKLNEARRNQRQSDTLLTRMTDGVISFDMKGKVTYINPAAATMLELKDSDNTFNKIFYRYKDINMEKIIYLENWTSSERKIENNQGSMNLSFIPFKDGMNRPIGVMVVIQDITEHIKLDNMRKEFVADVSHELKTPLTAIIGSSEILQEDSISEKDSKHFSKMIYDNAIRMQKIVQDLLELSKYDSKLNPDKITEFDLGELCKKCTESFEFQVESKQQNLQCLVTSDIPLISADKDGIEKVIMNVISNSVKYTPEGGNIDVYVGSVHNDVYVKVKDTGIGIPQEDLERIFERFYRVDKARTRQMGGTGLGLAIVKEIIEQNNGSIDIKSELNKGTEITIRLPIKKSKNAE